jgi:hypothetical protein
MNLNKYITNIESAELLTFDETNKEVGYNSKKPITIRKNTNKLEFLNPATNAYEKLKLIGFNENSDDSAHTFNNAWLHYLT